MKHIVDTHVFLWHLAGSPRLSASAKAVLLDPASELVLPGTAYGEACWIVEHGRVPQLTTADIQAALDNDPHWTIVPLGREVIDISQSLIAINEMHDRQIVATALLLARQGNVVALLTHDDDITQARVVPVVW